MAASNPLPLDPIAEARRQWSARGWGEVAEGMAAVTSLMRAQQIILARVEAVLRPRGLTFARYELLMLLTFSRHGAMSMKRASSRLQVHPTSVTNAVDRLEAAGLVLRRAHPRDGRATLVELTTDGRSAAEEATAELNSTVFADPGLDTGRLGQLVEVLTELRRDAGDFEG